MPPSPLSLFLSFCARGTDPNRPVSPSVRPSVFSSLTAPPPPPPRPCLYLADCRFVNLSATVYWRCGCKREESLPITYYYFNPSQRSGGRERGDKILCAPPSASGGPIPLPQPLRARTSSFDHPFLFFLPFYTLVRIITEYSSSTSFEIEKRLISLLLSVRMYLSN